MEQTEKLLLRSSSSEDMTPEMGLRLGHALAKDYDKVVIGMDLMRSSRMMKNALIASLVASGVDVIDIGVVSGPVISYAAKMGDCAVYVTEFRQLDLMSGYLLINKDGSYFGIDQVRHLEYVSSSKPELPDYKSLGTVKRYYNAVSDYNSKLLSMTQRNVGGSIVLNCNCGTATDSAPQILNTIGTDVISINAQKDRDFVSNSLSTKETDTHHMKTLVEANTGSTGISINRVGTLLKVFDESGEDLPEEKVLALIILYLKPKKLVVPMDMTWFIEDLFRGKIDIEVSTPYSDPDAEEMEFIVAEPAAGSVHKAMSEHCADLGYYQGGIVFGDISYSPDAIYASIVLSEFSGNNNVMDITNKFPAYFSERKSYKFSCSRDDYVRMLNARIPDVSPIDVKEDNDCWRVDMNGGGFVLTFDEDQDDTIDVFAESNDKLYLISLMEVIDGLMEACESGQ